MTKTVSWVLGVILVVAGIWGFFADKAVGFIAADTISSIIHLVVGLVVIITASKCAGMTLKIVGIIYIIWGILGMVGWNFTVADSVTNWFYLVVGLVVAIIGFMSKGDMSSAAPAPTAPQM